MYGDSTRSIHAGRPRPLPGEPFLRGPAMASTFPLDPTTGPVSGVDSYGRPDSSTRRQLETAIGDLEGGRCLTFATGMAAISAALLALVRSGDEIVLPSDGYFLTRSWASDALTGFGVTIRLAPTASAMMDFTGVRLVVLETPANPGLDVCDIAEISAAAHAAGALVAVDNTTATPLGQNPLELGADLVLASGTKALTGHSDLLLGYLATRDEQLLARLTDWRKATGAVPGDFEAWLAHRSLATLDLRLSRQTENAAAVAAALVEHPVVRSVRWPGLPTDPSYVVARRQMRRIPGVVTFELDSAEAALAFFEASDLVLPATSFGGLHSTGDRRAQWGDDTPPGLVRLSCGIEDPQDLVGDVVSALDRLR